MSPAEIAAAALKLDVDEVLSVEAIKHGLTNESWLVKTRHHGVVVRVSTADEHALHIDRRSEQQILALVSAVGVGPPLIHCDPDRHVLVTRYLGAPWTNEDARLDANISRLALLLQRLHQLAAPAGARVVDLAAEVQGYAETLELYGCGGALTEASVRAQARSAAALLQEGSIARLCHNDVHHLNLVDDGELRLIDWEYAGLGEPLFDLASVCVYHGYERARRELLLHAYAPNVSDALVMRLDAAIWLFEYIRDLWMAVRALDSSAHV